MGKTKSNNNKKVNDFYLVLHRKRGWQKLYEIMSRKNIVSKINSESWQELSIEQKRSFLRNIRSEYVGYLGGLGMSKQNIMKTKAYLLLNIMCNFKTKTMQNHKSVLSTWRNLSFCALNHA